MVVLAGDVFTKCNLPICNGFDQSQSHTNVITKLASELELLLEYCVYAATLANGAKRFKRAGQTHNYSSSHWKQIAQFMHSPN